MGLSSNALSDLIKSNLQNVGAKGSNLTVFCQAVAAGIVSAIVGQTFTTMDVGSVSGSGTGVGTGITGLSVSNMADSALAAMSSRGSNASPLMQSIMAAVVQHLGDASLSSVDNPVFIGTGTIVVGSISVTENEMAAKILSELQNAGANGSNLSNLSTAIATGIASNILNAGTGMLNITGSGGTPSHGTGSGTGTIS